MWNDSSTPSAIFLPSPNGYTAAYVNEHFPGWTWNSLILIWQAAGIVVKGEAGGGPLRCDERVKAIHFDHANSFAVEWIDGTVTTT